MGGIPLWDNPYNIAHGLSIDVSLSLKIPLYASGTIVGFQTQVPTPNKLATCKHLHMTSSHPWNPANVVMVQTTDQGGRNHPWKRLLSAATQVCHPQFEYLEADSNDALLDSIDPLLTQTDQT